MQTNVLEYFIRTCQAYPQKVAVVDVLGSWTFDELQHRARATSWVIRERTPLINTPVVIYLPKSKEAVAAILATLYSGNCYAPLDPKAPYPRIKSILAHLSPSAIITNRQLQKVLLDNGCDPATCICVEDICVDPGNYDGAWRRCIDTDPVYIIHTSGSTGRPKGVVIPHRGVIDYIDWAIGCFSIDERCVIGNQAPLIFDNSTLDLYLCFACGATLHLIPDELFMFPVRLLEYLYKYSINFIFWVPSVLVNVANKEILDKKWSLKLEKVLFAGEVMPAKQLNMWRKQLPNATFANLYGPTEITVDCTCYIVSRQLRDDESVPIGKACRNTGILILNEKNALCQPLEKGELCVRGSSLALGYWNDYEKTVAMFVQNPLNQNYTETIYRTGDLVFESREGEIIYVGRKDHQIKHMGYRIELGEIEHFALQIPGVKKACVHYERENKQIILCYEGDHQIDPGLFREEMGRHLPKYMWPTLFRQFAELPRTPNGKIDRQEIALQCSCDNG